MTLAARPLEVLVVEDDPDDAALLVRHLRRAGLVVRHRRIDTLAALRTALAEQVWDVILSDFSLPGFDGLTVFDAVSQGRQRPPFVLVSGHLSEAQAAAAMRAGVADFVRKDQPERLAPVVEREVTARQGRSRIEAALRESESRLAQVLGQLPVLLWTTDEATRVTSTSGGRTHAGGPRSVGFDVLLARLDADPPDPDLASAHRRALAGEEVRCDLGEGDAWFHCELQPLRGPDGEIVGVAGFAHDVTERRKLEQQVVAAQRMEGLGRLAGGVAHDFNNVLTIVLAHAEFILEDSAPTSSIAGDATVIRDAAVKASSLVAQLLAFSRRQVMRMELLDLNRSVSDLERMVRRVIGENVALSVQLAPRLHPVMADAGQIDQVILNLVVNARDALREGGRIVVATSNETVTSEFARTHVGIRSGDYVRVSVVDDGVGMDEATRSRVFEPFFTTKGAGAGTGLGLSTVYGIVKQIGGSVYVTSDLGRGTRFDVYLPRATGVARERRVQAPAGDLRGGETVLVVEDDPILRKSAARALSSFGYRVVTAEDAGLALETWRAAPGTIDLVLTDVVMPGPPVKQLTDAVLSGGETRVVLMSGYSEQMLVAQGDFEGLPFVSKPFTPTSLAHAVRKVLDSHDDPPRRAVRVSGVGPSPAALGRRKGALGK